MDKCQMLIAFAKEKEMQMKSTYFERKELHEGTWTSPGWQPREPD